MLRSALDWVDDRTGLVSAVQDFFEEDIPASSGWHQVFGSVALFAIMIQFATGLLLAFNYAPQPGEAWYSVQYIMNEVTGGRLIRGLHHFGASVAVIVVVLHMVQVIVWGAYKKPREATWLAGVGLLLLTLAFGLTGYLLPWDNRAYWSTVVTLQIASLPPIMGDLTLRLLGSNDGGVGVATFTRFYTLHVMALPAITAALAVFHVAMVRRHGIAPVPGDEVKAPQKFYPSQVFKDTVAIFAVFAILFGLAVFAEAPLGELADPTDTSFVPRPEWYFLFLFQLLKFFEGGMEIVGAVVLPGLAVAALTLLPWIDRSKAKKVGQRGAVIAGVGLVALGWTALTVAAIRSTPEPKGEVVAVDAAGPSWKERPIVEVAGYAYFVESGCSSCHNLFRGEPKAGPALATMDEASAPSAIQDHVSDKGEFSSDQIAAFAALANGVTPETAAAFEDPPEFALLGAKVYHENQCAMCHRANGEGGEIGPPLHDLAARRDAAWMEGHLRDPQAFVEGSTMPGYDFPEREMQAIVQYMLAL